MAERMRGNTYGAKPRSEETKLRMSAAFKGRIYSDDHNEKVRLSRLGSKASAETKAKMSSSRLGRVRPQSWYDAMAAYRANNDNPMKGKISPMRGKKFPTIECEHCGKQAAKGNYLRWHGTNCRHKEAT